MQFVILEIYDSSKKIMINIDQIASICEEEKNTLIKLIVGDSYNVIESVDEILTLFSEHEL